MIYVPPTHQSFESLYPLAVSHERLPLFGRDWILPN